jgi:hypothetical protein
MINLQPKKIFCFSYYSSDTCGNTWVHETKLPHYLAAADIKAAWKHIGSPRVTEYTLKDGTTVSLFRTPKGKGYWENNPNFDFASNLKNIKAFESGGFLSVVCEELLVETATV